MRAAAILLSLLLLGAGVWYSFQEFNPTQNQSLTRLIPAGTEVILRINPDYSNTVFKADSNSGFSFLMKALNFPPSLGNDIGELKSTALVCLSDSNDLTLISQDRITTSLSLIQDASSSNFVYSNGREYQPISESESQQLDQAVLSFIEPSSLQILTRPNRLMSSVSAFSEPSFAKLISSKLPPIGWMAIESTDENNLLKLDGIGLSQDTAINEVSNAHLLRYIPSQSGLTVFDKVGDLNYVIGHVDYQAGSDTGDENVIVILEQTTQHLNSEGDYKGIPIATQSISIAQGLWYTPTWSEEAFQAQFGSVSIYASSFEQLSKVIDDIIADNKLSTSAAFEGVQSHISENGFTVFIKPNKLRENPFINSDLLPSELNALAFQSFTDLSEESYFSFSVLHHTDLVDKLPEVWNLSLDTEIKGGPWAFVNHYSGKNELLIQDKLNRLYLINDKGRTLWTKQLENQIKGGIQYLDGFGSGKYQMLFSTHNLLHLVDRNGNEVDGYPVAHSKGANNFVSPIKYKGSEAFRILSQNGSILKNYDTEGNEVKGWKNPDLGSPLILPVQYFREGRKDYLVAITKDNKIHFLDRTGKNRKPSIQLDSAMVIKHFQPKSTLNESVVYGYDNSGNVYIRKLKDETVIKNLLPLGEDVGFEVIQSASTKFLAVKGDHLIGLDENLDVSLDYLLPEAVQKTFQLADSEKEYLQLHSLDSNRQYIFITEGRMLESMPVLGSGKVLILDLNLDQSLELVTRRSKNKLVVYKLPG